MDNEPAFPTDHNSITGKYRGVTVRDYFAAAALQGLCARMSDERYKDLLNDIQAGGNEAKVAGQLASEMLKERNK